MVGIVGEGDVFGSEIGATVYVFAAFRKLQEIGWTPARIDHYLKSPSRAIDGRAPVDLIATGEGAAMLLEVERLIKLHRAAE